jgi:hypothetical protein
MAKDGATTRIRKKTVLELEMASGATFEAYAAPDGREAHLQLIEGDVATDDLVLDRDLLKALLELLDEARSRATFGELPPLHPQPAEETHTT